MDDAGADTEVDQEFEDACWALGMSEGPKATPTAEAPRGFSEPPAPSPSTAGAAIEAVPWRRSFAPTAADLAEELPEVDEHRVEAPAETTATDLDPIPAVAEPALTVPKIAERPKVTASPAAPDTAELDATRADLAAAHAELDSLRADFQAERFRARDERMRLEDELAAARSSAALPAGSELAAVGGRDEIHALEDEIEALRGQLAEVRAQHADDVAHLESEVKSAQAREAQQVIAVQLAEDELAAVRADHQNVREELAASHGQQATGQADLAAAQAAFDDALKSSARDLTAARGEADALRQMVDELQAREAELTARWDTERRALQDEIRAAREAGAEQVRQIEAQLADKHNDLRIARESAADRIRQVDQRLAETQAELASTQQELLDAEVRRAEEAASFLQALHK